MSNELKGKRIAILATEGFEEVELTKPREALEKAGAKTELISLEAKEIRSWKTTEWGGKFKPDRTVEEAKAGDYDGLLLPGGVMNPDKLRVNEKAVEFVRAFFDEDKPVAAICHGPWMLVEADATNGRKLTSWPAIKTDLVNAGAEWVDESAVVDGKLVTSRKPDDIPDFNKAMLRVFAEAGAPVSV